MSSNIQIYNEDCLNVFPNIGTETVDLVVTDPPYRTISGGTNQPEGFSGYPKSVLKKNDGKIFDNNDIDHQKWISECYRVLRPNSHLYLMTNLYNLFEFWEICVKQGFKLHNLLVWEKNTANANRWYMKNCEYTLFFYKGRAKPINHCGSKTVHQFDNPTGNKIHPTEKPVDLMRYYVTNSSKEGDLILDPFVGGGQLL